MDAAIFTAVFIMVCIVEVALATFRYKQSKKQRDRLRHKLNLCSVNVRARV
jgi:hypothetical protein